MRGSFSTLRSLAIDNAIYHDGNSHGIAHFIMSLDLKELITVVEPENISRDDVGVLVYPISPRGGYNEVDLHNIYGDPFVPLMG